MGLTHRALLYDGRSDFLAATGAFLRQAVEVGGAAVAVVRPDNLGPLREELADHRDEIEFYDSAEFYRHPVRTLKAYLELVDRVSPLRVHAVAEPVWDGHDARQRLEWQRYESLINVVFAGSGASSLCPYDRSTLPGDVLDQVRLTHPVVVDGADERPSDAYLDPASYSAAQDLGRRHDRPADAEYLPIEADDLQPLRLFVATRANAHELTPAAAQNLVTAANEVAANALAHGTPPMGAWVWTSGDEIVCEIGDHGHWRPPPLTGFVPPRSALDTGFGLWSVRLLVDLVELRGGWGGTFVRLRVRR
ncbi:sensor histidine kinase [Actinomadura rayongensis]|uniref:Sensor histidine kinase n=1 Tax=Actinomadura rayongensis TaxID=1429076 RepID=A0A6I4W0A8_9ACTN|nr:sensor histidine kinase [Actinomadura rayongensis]MXQ62861.1 sensor histidine kinase [Actinomadura rayongensis]